MKLQYPVLMLLLLTAAALQLLPSPAGAMKFPWLAGVAVYYALNRGLGMAVLAAAWAGILLDALGGVPSGTSVLFLVSMALVVAGVKEMAPENSLVAAALLGAVVSPLLMLAQFLALWRGGFARPAPGALMVPFDWLVPMGAFAACAAAAAGRRLDLLAANVKGRKEVEGRGE